MNRAHQCSIDTINLAYVLTMKRLQEISEDWRSAVGGSRAHACTHLCEEEAGSGQSRSEKEAWEKKLLGHYEEREEGGGGNWDWYVN